jgi:two-component system chemotaxis response regulator CheY
MNKTVLIVDDAAFMRMTLKLLLEKNGYTVVGEAENGEIAVKKYKELKPGVVTMDITMPKMDGVKALKLIKEYDSKAVVVMVSGLGQENLVRESILSGAGGFVLKPFKEEHLILSINKLVK